MGEKRIMSVFNNGIHFHGTWRPYQQRVLDELATLGSDQKIHIVAAPGSGKTTLGLEIITRLGAPTLVAVPTITIEQQWAQRFTEAFLSSGESADAWVSTSLDHLKPLTIVTYQALYSAFSQESTQDSKPQRKHAPSSALIARLVQAGVSTLCLDEAHHLRTQWWKALVSLRDELKAHSSTQSRPTTLALTADSTSTEWSRYIELCGDIDCEIFTPELVADATLCPIKTSSISTTQPRRRANKSPPSVRNLNQSSTVS
jgi:superfamily II DNA or RNA helicase